MGTEMNKQSKTELFWWLHSPLAFPRALDLYDLSEDHGGSQRIFCFLFALEKKYFVLDEWIAFCGSQKLPFFGPKLDLLPFCFSP